MQFALFYEIPAARPWHERSEWEAYKNVLEQAVLGDRVGFHSFWSVEHLGKVRNERAATFTLVHCAPSDAEAFAEARESFPSWIPHARVMRSIELLGRHVLPAFA